MGDNTRVAARMLTVNEIFHSIQGESTRAGQPCVFVRLTACDLRCSWCDTPYAFHEGRKMSLDEVVREVERYGCPLVEITGGEPLLQDEVYPLMDRLLAAGRTVMLETGRPPLDRPRARRGRESRRREVPRERRSPIEDDWSNLDRLAPHDEVKFVVQDRADYEYAREVDRAPRPGGEVRGGPAVAGPRRPGGEAAVGVDPRGSVCRARLQVQLHKFIWPPATRGVWSRPGGRAAERRPGFLHGRRDRAAPTASSCTR